MASKKELRYISLFSGIGGFELALERVFGDKAKCVGFCEVNKDCRSIYTQRFPSHPLVGDGDVQNADFRPLRGKVDLVVAGFPCQDLSSLNRSRRGLEGKKSSLLFEALRCLQETNAPYFVFENVNSMSKAQRAQISSLLGTQPVMLDAANLTFQRRRRLFWANFQITPIPNQPGKATFVSLLDPVAKVSHLKKSERFVQTIHKVLGKDKKGHDVCRKDHYNIHHDTKDVYSKTLIRRYSCSALFDRRVDPPLIRGLSLYECERLQGFPEDWTDGGVTNGARYQALGNAVNVAVARHIFSCFNASIK